MIRTVTVVCPYGENRTDYRVDGREYEEEEEEKRGRKEERGRAR